MIQWFTDLFLITKLRLIIESILIWTYVILIIAQEATLNIFNYEQIIKRSGKAFYYLNLILLVICLCSLLIRLFSIIFTKLNRGRKNKPNNHCDSKIAYLLLANVYIEEHYDNYWYYPVLISFYLFHLLFFEVFFCLFLSFFSNCIQNNKNDKLYYYKKYSFSYKSKSFQSLDF